MDDIDIIAAGLRDDDNDAHDALARVAQHATMRYALVNARADDTEQIAAYLPRNYRVIGRTAIQATAQVYILIGGSDVAGWTLDDYVIPRLASGLIFAEEIS